MIILRQSLFAIRDYEGLSQEGKDALAARRNKLAADLRKRRFENDSLGSMMDSEGWNKSGTRQGMIKKELDNTTSLKNLARQEELKADRARTATASTQQTQQVNTNSNPVNSNGGGNYDKTKSGKEVPTTNATKKPKPEPKIKGRDGKFLKFVSKHKKPLMIGGGIAALGGLGYAGYKSLNRD